MKNINKEEILEKARKENKYKDEGKTNVENKWRKKSMIFFFIIGAILMIVNQYYNTDSKVFDIIMSFWWLFLGFEAVEKFNYSKKTILLIASIICFILSAIYIGIYLMTIFNITIQFGIK